MSDKTCHTCPFSVPCLEYSSAGVISGTGCRCAHPDFYGLAFVEGTILDPEKGCEQHPSVQQRVQIENDTLTRIVKEYDKMRCAQQVYERLWIQLQSWVISFLDECRDASSYSTIKELLLSLDEIIDRYPKEIRESMPQISNELRDRLKL